MKQLNPVLHFILEQRYILNNLSEQVGTAFGAAEAAAARGLRIRPGTLGELGAEESAISKLRRQKQGSPYEIPQIDSSLSKLIDELNLISKENLWASKQGQIVETELKNAIEEALSKGKQNALGISLEVAKTKPDLFKSVHSATIVDKLNTMTLKRVGEVEAKQTVTTTDIPVEAPVEVPVAPKFTTQTKVATEEPSPFEFPVAPTPSEVPVASPQTQPQTQLNTAQAVGTMSLFPSFDSSVFQVKNPAYEKVVTPELQTKAQLQKAKTPPKIATEKRRRPPEEYGMESPEEREEPETLNIISGETESTDVGTEIEKLLGKYSGTQRLK